MSRARESKLRTLMLRLHEEGVAVTFAKGRPGQPLADVFFVKIEDQDYVRILSEINEALDASAEAAYDKNASIKYADAEAFVEQIREIKELSNEAERDKGIRPSGLRIDEAMARSIAQSPPRLLSFASATAFVENIESLSRGSSEHKQSRIPPEPELADLQSGKIDVFRCQEDKNGNKKERQLNLPL